MGTALLQLLRSRWFTLAIHAALWILLCAALANWGIKGPEQHEAASFSVPIEVPVPVSKLATLFSAGQWPRSAGNSNAGVNAFFTMHFVPPSPAPPLAPKTRKIEVVYQGFYHTADDCKQVVVKVADQFVIAQIGAAVATNHFVADVTMQGLLLTNVAGQTNLLPLNMKKEIEVPIK